MEVRGVACCSADCWALDRYLSEEGRGDATKAAILSLAIIWRKWYVCVGEVQNHRPHHAVLCLSRRGISARLASHGFCSVKLISKGSPNRTQCFILDGHLEKEAILRVALESESFVKT